MVDFRDLHNLNEDHRILLSTEISVHRLFPADHFQGPNELSKITGRKRERDIAG